MDKIFITICIINILFVFATLYILHKKQKQHDEEYNKVKDMKQCPQLSEYIIRFQSNFQTFQIALLSFFGMFLVHFILLNILMKDSKQKLFISLFISFYLGLLGFIIAYKVQNCVLARICFQKGCSSNYFN